MEYSKELDKIRRDLTTIIVYINENYTKEFDRYIKSIPLSNEDKVKILWQISIDSKNLYSLIPSYKKICEKIFDYLDKYFYIFVDSEFDTDKGKIKLMTYVYEIKTKFDELILNNTCTINC